VRRVQGLRGSPFRVLISTNPDSRTDIGPPPDCESRSHLIPIRLDLLTRQLHLKKGKLKKDKWTIERQQKEDSSWKAGWKLEGPVSLPSNKFTAATEEKISGSETEVELVEDECGRNILSLPPETRYGGHGISAFGLSTLSGTTGQPYVEHIRIGPSQTVTSGLPLKGQPWDTCKVATSLSRPYIRRNPYVKRGSEHP